MSDVPLVAYKLSRTNTRTAVPSPQSAHLIVEDIQPERLSSAGSSSYATRLPKTSPTPPILATQSPPLPTPATSSSKPRRPQAFRSNTPPDSTALEDISNLRRQSASQELPVTPAPPADGAEPPADGILTTNAARLHWLSGCRYRCLRQNEHRSTTAELSTPRYQTDATMDDGGVLA